MRLWPFRRKEKEPPTPTHAPLTFAQLRADAASGAIGSYWIVGGDNSRPDLFEAMQVLIAEVGRVSDTVQEEG